VTGRDHQDRHAIEAGDTLTFLAGRQGARRSTARHRHAGAVRPEAQASYRSRLRLMAPPPPVWARARPRQTAHMRVAGDPSLRQGCGQVLTCPEA